MPEQNKQSLKSFIGSMLSLIFPFAFVAIISIPSYYLYAYFAGIPVPSVEASTFLAYAIVASFGLFLIVATFAAWSTKGSGTPLIGGLLLLLAGLLLAPTKWLCLLALLDPIFLWYLPPIRRSIEAKQKKYSLKEERNRSASQIEDISEHDEKK